MKATKKQTVTVSKIRWNLYRVELDASYSEFPVHMRHYKTYGWAMRHARELVNGHDYNLRDLAKN